MTTRRELLTAVPGLLAASAMPSVAHAGAEDDRELRRLWSDYLTAASAYMVARDVHDPLRDAYDADFAPDGITPALVARGGYCKGPLWEESVEPAWQAVNDAGEECRRVISAIRATSAEGLAGVAIKIMAQLPLDVGDPEDVIEGLDAVQEDIARLTGLTMPDLSRDGGITA